MSHHKRIDEIVEFHLSEAKKPVDIGFEFIGKDMNNVKITYINPKAKNLPHWAKVGATVKSKEFQSSEADWEVYNLDGRTVKDGYVIDLKKGSSYGKDNMTRPAPSSKSKKGDWFRT
jgi:hypothetical protein